MGAGLVQSGEAGPVPVHDDTPGQVTTDRTRRRSTSTGTKSRIRANRRAITFPLLSKDLTRSLTEDRRSRVDVEGKPLSLTLRMLPASVEAHTGVASGSVSATSGRRTTQSPERSRRRARSRGDRRCDDGREGNPHVEQGVHDEMKTLCNGNCDRFSYRAHAARP